VPRSTQWSLSLRFSHQNTVHAASLPHTRYMPVRLIVLDLITRTIIFNSERGKSLVYAVQYVQ
jgi:hypothetical protein